MEIRMFRSRRLAVAVASACLVAGLHRSAAGQPSQNGAAPDQRAVRRLSLDDAVKLSLEQNLGIQVERLNPQIQDTTFAQLRGAWVPNLTSSFFNNSTDSPSTTALAGGQNKVVNTQASTQVGLNQLLPTGGNYSVAWNGTRSTSTNLFSNFEPLLSSNVSLNVTQPLLRNFKIDSLRQQLDTARKDRDGADIQLRTTTAQTVRNVKNAYWDLVFQRDNLAAQRQSLDLSRRLLADNEKRVQIGTMAPIDIVEAQSEVARNEESVIVAEAAITAAEDRLRTLIFDAASPDFWSVGIEPTDVAGFQSHTVDLDDAVRRALAQRTDLQQAKTSIARTDISIRYFRNQLLPDLNAQATYTTAGVGGTQLSPLTSFSLGQIERTPVSNRGFGSVLGDVFTSSYPAWTVGVTVGYPIGHSASESSLARAKLQHTQAQTQLKNLEVQVVAEVRDAARQVQTNQKRVDSARAARALAEKRLEAEERKMAAGVQISFFVFQAQRDLAQARASELRALADFNKSIVNFEAVQEISTSGLALASAGSTGSAGAVTPASAASGAAATTAR
jgi:outer membrane protein